MKFEDHFKIRVVYKSGYTHDFWVKSFNTNGTSFTWDSVEVNNRPLMLGADDVAAVWQIDTRKRVIWKAEEKV
jgi:hypothetical protein